MGHPPSEQAILPKDFEGLQGDLFRVVEILRSAAERKEADGPVVVLDEPPPILLAAAGGKSLDECQTGLRKRHLLSDSVTSWCAVSYPLSA